VPLVDRPHWSHLWFNSLSYIKGCRSISKLYSIDSFLYWKGRHWVFTKLTNFYSHTLLTTRPRGHRHLTESQVGSYPNNDCSFSTPHIAKTATRHAQKKSVVTISIIICLWCDSYKGVDYALSSVEHIIYKLKTIPKNGNNLCLNTKFNFVENAKTK